MATASMPKNDTLNTTAVTSPGENDWTKPAAMSIPEEGYFTLENGRYGPTFPKTPACYGFSVVAEVKPGLEQAIRDYGKNIEEAVKSDPTVLKPLKLHYLRWVLFDVGSAPTSCIKASSTPISINTSRMQSRFLSRLG